MSLRETFLKAQKDGYEALLDADKKTISDKLADFASKIPASMKDVTAIARTGATLEDEQKKALAINLYLPTLPLSNVDQKALESLPGYRRLHGYCQSNDADLCMNVLVSSASRKDRFGNLLAYINVTIDPLKGFDASELTQYSDGDYTKAVKASLRKPLPTDGETKAPGSLSL